MLGLKLTHASKGGQSKPMLYRKWQAMRADYESSVRSFLGYDQFDPLDHTFPIWQVSPNLISCVDACITDVNSNATSRKF